MSRPRVKIEDIVRVRDGRHECPQCHKPMAYRRVVGAMKKWSPIEYAWFCETCPTVRLDGSINPSDRTWRTRIKAEERRRIFAALSAAYKRGKK